MTIEEIAIVAQMVGSVAVVASVIYLALQIRAQIQQSRLEASRELAVHWNETVARLIEEGDFPSVYLRGASEYEKLSREEKFRFSIFVSTLVRLGEQQYLHVKRGRLDPIFFESSENLYAELLRLPGVQIWWANNRATLSQEYSQHMELRIQKAREKGYDSSFRIPGEAPPDDTIETDN